MSDEINITIVEEPIYITISDVAEPGMSAYEVALANGFEGSASEWLDSLKGEDGQDGADGQDGEDGTGSGGSSFDLGDGSDGDYVAENSTLVLDRDYYFKTLVFKAGGFIDMNSYRIWCQEKPDVREVEVGALINNGFNGIDGFDNGGGANYYFEKMDHTLGGGSQPGNGGSEYVGGNGEAGLTALTRYSSGGGKGGAGGEGGWSNNAIGGMGGIGGLGGDITRHLNLKRAAADILYGANLVGGGTGGGGGGASGGVYAVSAGRGGASGGGPGGVALLICKGILSGPSTPAGWMQCRGGNGGRGYDGDVSHMDVGGGAGGGGGGGGWIILVILNDPSGTVVAGALDASGGDGGRGGDSAGDSYGGDSGQGGQGGRITIINLDSRNCHRGVWHDWACFKSWNNQHRWCGCSWWCSDGGFVRDTSMKQN